MNSRERVKLALDHQEPDRIPIDLGATIVSSITRSSYIPLKQQLGLPLEEIKMLDYVQQLPYVDGGFVFAAIHNIQAFVPPENIIAAFDTAFTYGRY